ncbi:hypothetical protein LWI29_021245 [Acer saccharum]|uniref:Zinc finger PHD-type domain-containing protein n=1 Tax=Acer saccharum TaxID=4024 RepID=A0AA39VWB7_ACESA|nr:hypothetical protein LWI29_021245 [Acer saccharum]
MEIIKHFSHPDHPLKLVKSIERSMVPNCDCCCEEMSFPGYACHEISAKPIVYWIKENCNFYLHKSCAELAQKISHPLHLHPLILSEIPGFNGIICDGCRNLYKKGFTYYCSWCEFNLHPKCASKHDHEELLQQQTFNKALTTLYHFCHKHALNFCNLKESNGKDCCCCNKSISGSAYCCLECEFFIHESCKEIPMEVQQPFHPQHNLRGQAVDRYNPRRYKCESCKSSIRGIRISCNMCHFDLHVSCANPNRCALKHKCHEHNMYYFVEDGTTAPFECSKCHEKCLDDEPVYRCVECDFNLHFKCIPISSDVMITQKHHHPLTLIDSVKEDNPLIQYLIDSNDKVDYSMDYYCDECETPGNPKHHAYYCKECIYIAHIECIIFEDNTPPEIPSDMNITHGTEQKMSDEADHITELQAEESMPKKNGATTSLDSKCKDNEQLFSHPSHPHHKLTLLQLEPTNGGSSEKIKNLYKKGFTYYCSWSCGFNLDLKCASKHDHEELLQQRTFNKELTLYHFCHKHELNFCNLRDSYYKPCCCCKKIIRGSAYCCLECRIFIHESCKEIPEQVQHPFHPQHLLLAQAMEVTIHVPLKLWKSRIMYPWYPMYPPDTCNACLLPIRGIKISCIKCYFNLHVSCANPNYRALKHKFHEHNMYYFVDTTGSFECNKCYERCTEKSFYRCMECDFHLHLKRIPIQGVVTVTQKHHHPLTLIDSVKEDNPLIQYIMDSNDKVDHSIDYYCDVCETPGNPKHHAYWWLLLFLLNAMPASFPQYVTEAITGPMPDPPGLKLQKEGLRAKHPVVFVLGIVTGGLELWEGHHCAEGLFRK